MPEGTIAQPIPPTMIRRFSWRRKLLGVPCAVVVVGGVGAWYGLTTAQHFQPAPPSTMTRLGAVYFARTRGTWRPIEWREGEPVRIWLDPDLPDLERVLRVEPVEYLWPRPRPWPECLRRRGIHAPFNYAFVKMGSAEEVWPVLSGPVSSELLNSLQEALVKTFENDPDPKRVEAARVIAAGAGGLRTLEWSRLGWWGVAVGKWIALAAVGLGCVRAVVPKRGEVRRDRAARGLCVWCAYPRGDEDVCAECGRPVTG